MPYIFLVIFIAAMVGVIRPYKFINGSKRWHYGLAAFVSFVFVGVTAPDPETAGGTAEAGDATSTKAPAPVEEGKPGPTAKADAIAFFKTASRTLDSCDKAGGRLSEAESVVGLYRAAEEMESACLSTPGEIRDWAIPDSVGDDVYKQFEEAISYCDSAYLAKWSAARAMKDALENSNSIAAQAELQKAAEASSHETMLCAAALVTPAMELGATSEDLGLGK